MNSRIIKDTETNQFVDEVLEVVFRQLFYWEVDGAQAPAMEALLDQYSSACYKAIAVPAKGIITDESAAKLWAEQFGELRVYPLSGRLVKSIRKQNSVFRKIDIKFGGKIDPSFGPSHVFGRSVHQVTLLAAVQVLREVADTTLNVVANSHHH